MKKLFCVVFVYTFIIASIVAIGFWQNKVNSVNAFENKYAQVLNNNVYLYKFPTDDNDVQNKYFLIEPTYFVKLTNMYNNQFYKAEYNGITGYVKNSEVKLTDYVPQKPFLTNITFEINSTSNAFIRSEPTTKFGDKNVIKILPSKTKNIQYLGKISSEEAISGAGNIWYYCKISDFNNNANFGYVYSPLTTNISNINKNDETVICSTKIADPFNLLYINIKTQNLVTLVLAIPMLMVVYLFVKPTKIINKLN